MKLSLLKFLLLFILTISCSNHDPFYIPEYEYIDYAGYVTFDSIDYEYKHLNTTRLDTLIFGRYLLTDTSNLENYKTFDMDSNIVIKLYQDSIFNPWDYVSIGLNLNTIKSIMHYVQHRLPEPYRYKILFFDSVGVYNDKDYYHIYHKNTFITQQ